MWEVCPTKNLPAGPVEPCGIYQMIIGYRGRLRMPGSSGLAGHEAPKLALLYSRGKHTMNIVPRINARLLCLLCASLLVLSCSGNQPNNHPSPTPTPDPKTQAARAELEFQGELHPDVPKIETLTNARDCGSAICQISIARMDAKRNRIAIVLRSKRLHYGR